jgi:hypothetical protein
MCLSPFVPVFAVQSTALSIGKYGHNHEQRMAVILVHLTEFLAELVRGCPRAPLEKPPEVGRGIAFLGIRPNNCHPQTGVSLSAKSD